jgi:NitT/TauT family transport system substrate-binding protein
MKTGKYKVAVNALKAYTYYTTLRAAEKYGIDKANIEFVVIPIPDQSAALMKGDVDVIALPIPYTEFITRDLGDKVAEIGNAYDIAGNHASSYIFVNRVWAENNVDTAQSFVTAIGEAEDWIQLNQGEAKAIVSKYTDIPADILPDFFYNEHGAIDMAQIKAWQDYQKSTGDIAVDWLTPEQVGTNSYNLLLK